MPHFITGRKYKTSSGRIMRFVFTTDFRDIVLEYPHLFKDIETGEYTCFNLKGYSKLGTRIVEELGEEEIGEL